MAPDVNHRAGYSICMLNQERSSLSQTYEQFPLGPLTADKCGKYAAVWALRTQTPGLSLFISQCMFSVDVFKKTRSAQAF